MARKSKRRRDAGLPWRLLAHHADGNAREITDDGTDFDELVVGRWLHIERMSTKTWWMDIGGVTVHVDADRDGQPRHVRVNGPLDYNAPVEGCAYDVVWTDIRDAAGLPEESADAH